MVTVVFLLSSAPNTMVAVVCPVINMSADYRLYTYYWFLCLLSSAHDGRLLSSSATSLACIDRSRVIYRLLDSVYTLSTH